MRSGRGTGLEGAHSFHRHRQVDSSRDNRDRNSRGEVEWIGRLPLGGRDGVAVEKKG